MAHAFDSTYDEMIEEGWHHIKDVHGVLSADDEVTELSLAYPMRQYRVALPKDHDDSDESDWWGIYCSEGGTPQSVDKPEPTKPFSVPTPDGGTKEFVKTNKSELVFA